MRPAGPAPAMMAVLGIGTFLLYPMFMPRKKNTRKKRFAYIGVILSVALLIGLYLVQQAAVPTILNVEYQFEGGERKEGSHPLLVMAESRLMHIDMDVKLFVFHPTRIHIRPDDCIEEITINGKEVDPEILGYCDYSTFGPILDLSSYLKPGNNHFNFLVRDNAGEAGMKITPARTDPFNIIFIVLYLVLIALLLQSVRSVIPKKMDKALVYVFVWGVLLRVLYFIVTPYAVRGHDTDAHIDYIEYVARYLTIPPAAEGWEFHQAPLYYFVTGIWMKLNQLVGVNQEIILGQIKFMSLFFSIGVLVLGIWLGTLLFSKKDQRPERILFASAIACLPSLILLSTRITNNGFYILIAFIVVSLLIKWWRSEKEWDFYTLCIALGFCFITKVSGILFIIIIGLCFLYKFRRKLKELVTQGVIGLLIIVLLGGWLPVVRFALEYDPTNSITFGSGSMHSGLTLTSGIRNFVTFNPLEVVRIPFNNPWENSFRRQYFPEYFYRAAFFGEFRFDNQLTNIARTMLALGILLIPFLIIGFIKALRSPLKQMLPVWLILVLLAAAHMWYRLRAPFSANQDFRFSILLIVPLLVLLLTGLRTKGKYLSGIGRTIFVLLCISCSTFFVLLYFINEHDLFNI